MPGGGGKVGIGGVTSWSSRSPGPASYPSAGTCFRLVIGVPYHQPPFPQACGSPFQNALFVSPPPTPTLCTHPQEHTKQRRGSAAVLAELPPALSGGPALTFPLSPGYGQSPRGEQTPVCSSLPQSGVLFQGQWLTCQLLHHSLSSLPKDLPPFLSAKPLIWRQR